jgi:hypothetical protein
MGKVGRWGTDPMAGAYCKIALGGGETIIVNHEKGGFNGGWLTIERVKFMGLSSDRVFACNLDSEEARPRSGSSRIMPPSEAWMPLRWAPS